MEDNGFKDPNKDFDAYMLETTDEDIAQWYFEKTGKDWVSDTKTMSQDKINRLLNDFKTDVAQDMVANFDDELALSAREWLNKNTTRGLDPTAQMDDTLKSLELSNADMFPEEIKAAEQLADEDFFMNNIQPKIDDYYADLAAREPSQSELDKMNKGLTRDDPFSDIDVDAQARQAEQNRIEQLYDDTMADRAAREPDINKVNSYYESLSQADQGMIDNYYENLILDSQVIDVADNKVTGKLIKKTIKNRLKKLLIGGLDALDVYELGLIGMALVEPAVQKALQPLMPMIIPGFKGKLDEKSYKKQVLDNLQSTAKISPTAIVAEKITDIPKPQTQELTGMGWVGKMLDR